MVIEALKAARDFIENDRQAFAESLTVNGEIVFEDDIDRWAMAEYANVLAVIDGAIKQALAAPVQPSIKQGWDVDTLLDRRAAPVQEPLTWLKTIETPGGFGKFVEAKPHEKGAKPVYLTPPAAAQPAVPLTDEQIEAAVRDWHSSEFHELEDEPSVIDIARAIEAAHGITSRKDTDV